MEITKATHAELIGVLNLIDEFDKAAAPRPVQAVIERTLDSIEYRYKNKAA